jgi:YD repeat-containing protein
VKKKLLRTFVTALIALICTVMPLSVAAQQGGTTTYVYDDNGRLHAVISPTGEAVVYEYDAAGNIASIRRLAADALAIFSFSPHEGMPGDQVTFIGVGFGGGVSDVSFNGASATIVSVTTSRVVATVPPAATTGLVTITTPHGSVTSATPFTIAGVRINPTFAAIKFGESVQFAAEVLPSTLDQTVSWSVNDVAGGNAVVGTISTSGVYTAPNTAYSSLTIRATSVADTSRFAEARVKVSDPNDIQSVFAASVTVRRGDTANAAALAPLVTVRYGAAAESQTALAKGVTVQFGISGGVALSQSVSVQRSDTNKAAGISNPVSVQYGPGAQYTATAAVSATMGPYIQSIAPSNLTRGSSVTVTINGTGLSGATTFRFINASGANDTGITVSNIVVNADGTSLTATLTVSAGAALGTRVVVIPTPNGDSVRVDLGTNTISVVP